MVAPLKKKDVVSKERKALYKKAFALWKMGLTQNEVAKEIQSHVSTVQRAISWCKNFGYGVPTNNEALEQILLDKITRKVKLRNLLNKQGLSISDKCKLNREISNLDTEILQLKGVLRH